MFYCCHHSVLTDDAVVYRRTHHILFTPYIYLPAYGKGAHDWAQIWGLW
jgi:hypothetical protein